MARTRQMRRRPTRGSIEIMEFTPAGRRWSSPPLALQITGLLLGGLVIAQLVTLVLTLLLPPEPAKQYDLGDIAGALAGRDVGPKAAKILQRVTQPGPPRLTGPGWLTSEKSRHELALLLGRPDDAVQLWFYTPLPFAGTARPLPRDAAAEPAFGPRPALAHADDPGRFVAVDFPLARAAPSRPPGGADPARGGGPPSGNGSSQGDGSDRRGGTTDGVPFPPIGGPRGASSGTTPGGSPSTGASDRGAFAFPGGAAPGNGLDTGAAGSSSGPSLRFDDRARTLGAPPGVPAADGSSMPSSAGRAAPGGGPGPPPGNAGVQGRPSLSNGAVRAPRLALPANDDGGVVTLPTTRSDAPSRLVPAARTRTPAAPPASPPRAADAVTARVPAAAAVDREVGPAIANGGPSSSLRTVVRDAPIAATATRRGLFGLAPAPFVEGDFVAALQSADGWVVVQPTPEPFPNSWQRRVLLWFVVAFALIAPLGWLFSRRLVRPIAGFALAAEQLGRDPTAQVMALEGPAEVGRAAHAFNRMQSRLKSFVDDRTAMIGAISHDLRTPLTRLRFRIEDVEEDLRVGMLHEVDEMEAMITSVLAFIRDASEPGSREKLDLSTIVEDVVEDAVFVGRDVELTLNEKAPVEVDAIGMRRLLANLVENAVKYGDHARVRLFTDRSDAVTEVSDDGPGLPDDELERVFEPFYRASAARASDKQGSGLGLAVCRSIARAHGGDVSLMRGERGLIAQVRLPLAYGARG